MNSKYSEDSVASLDNVINSFKIDSEDMLQHVIGFLIKNASESPLTMDYGLTNLHKESKKISIPIHTKWSHGMYFTFEEILLENILSEFEKIVKLKQRAKDIAQCYKGPVELKEKWIELRFTELLPVQKSLVSRKIQFYSYLYHLGMISPKCIISVMEFLASCHSTNLQNFLLMELHNFLHLLIVEHPCIKNVLRSGNFFFKKSVSERLLDIINSMHSLKNSRKRDVKDFVNLPGIRNIITNIKLELEDEEIAKVRLEADKQNQLRLIEEKRIQLKLKTEKIMSEGKLQSVDEMEEKDFDNAMIVDLFN